MRHRDARLNHILENWTYADAAERLAAVGFLVEDEGKVAYEQDTGKYYRLVTFDPIVWAEIGGGGGGGGATLVRQVAPADLVGNTFDFVGIPNTHRNLRLIFIGRIVNTGGVSDTPLIARLKFNNAFGAIGIKTKQVGAGAPTTSLTTNTAAGVEIGEVQSLNDDSGVGGITMSEIIFEILEYANTTMQRGSFSKNFWKDTTATFGRNEYVIPSATGAAINRLTLSFDGIAAGNLKANSMCILELTD